MRNILVYSACFDGEYFYELGHICTFETEDIAKKICEILNNFVNNHCKEFGKEQFKKEDIYAYDFVLEDFLKEEMLEMKLKNYLLKILDETKIKNLLKEIKEHMSYIYIEEETFKIKQILEI